jgi:hypothetical protein
MVGPLSSEEIEDVVSSVRRLVSNEQSSRRVTRDLGADRLMLTPALRVVSEASPLSPLILEPEPPLAVSGLDETVTEAADLPEAGEADVELVEAEWEDEIWSPPEPASLGEVALGVEEAEVLVSPVEGDVLGEPVEAEAPVSPVKEAAAELSEDIHVETEENGEAWAQSDWTEDEPVPFIPLRRRAEHLAARLAAGEVMDLDEPEEAVHDNFPDEVAPDVAPELLEDDPLAADLDGDSPVATGLSDDTTDEASGQRMPTEFLDADGTPLAVLDEAALQEIVRQMIREELQGALGERITRNVRKLVRAEINRALIARDLD